mmetsp:Transcript_65250/g.121647  ORF Transcript_65250/g.121647 Transcript_65250/m.121647 type:complete len:312 (-) Transcript_65250:55-990(-)
MARHMAGQASWWAAACTAIVAALFVGAAMCDAMTFVPVVTSEPRALPLQRATLAAALQEKRFVPSSLSVAAAGLAACMLGIAASQGRLAARRSTVSRNYVKPHQLVAGVAGYRPEWQPIVGDAVKYPEPTSEKMFATMVGADVETGGRWDPLNFHKLFDRNWDFNMVMVYPHVQWLREAELKHGRIAMLAFVGVMVQSGFHFPGRPDVEWTEALGACCADKNARLGILQILVFIFIIEGKFYSGDMWVGMGEREAGDLGWDPLKLSRKEGYDAKKVQLQELKNGRLAMIGMASLACNKLIPGSIPLLNGMF